MPCIIPDGAVAQAKEHKTALLAIGGGLVSLHAAVLLYRWRRKRNNKMKPGTFELSAGSISHKDAADEVR